MMLTHLHSLCSLRSWRSAHPLPEQQLIPECLLGRVLVPSTHTPIPNGVPCSHPRRLTSSAATSASLTHHLRFLVCFVLGSFFFYFFFPPNLVSIETRLAEGEIKQPHVTQIPTLKNLLVALAVALHNQEPVRAQMGGPGSAEGHRAQPRRTRLRCTGSGSGEEYQAQLWRDHQAEDSDASPPLALGVLWQS